MSGGQGDDHGGGAGEVVRVEEHDVVGVGLGPFNLGLAALLDPLPEIDAVFLEARPAFSWHPGLLLDGTTLQVPFLADLVTLADPTSPYSFLNYLHRHGRLYRFYFYERFHVPRREYDDYCRWVAEHLRSCRFGQRVVAVSPLPDGRWSVLTSASTAGDGAEPGAADALVEHRAAAVVLGVGSTPAVPACARDRLGDTVLHSADYLTFRDRVRAAPRVTVIGSGQSAAEVFADLLAHGGAPGDDPAGSDGTVATGSAMSAMSAGSAGPDGGRGPQRLDWFTRSRGFLPMEYSKLGLEHFTPEYTAYFHGLDEERRDTLRSGQDLLYKGISSETSELIYDTLYEASIGGREPNVGYRSACELRAIEPAGPDDADGAGGRDGT
jgi:lysine N6-hydroxylase